MLTRRQSFIAYNLVENCYFLRHLKLCNVGYSQLSDDFSAILIFAAEYRRSLTSDILKDGSL